MRLSVAKFPRAILIALLLMLVLYGVHLRISITDFDRSFTAGDEATYHNAAISLLEEGVVAREPHIRHENQSAIWSPSNTLSPGYPAFLAVLYSLFGISSPVVYGVQVGLSVGALILVIAILAMLRVPLAAITVAGGAAAIYPGYIYNLDRLLTENLFVFLLLSSAALLLKYLESGGRIALGFAALTVGIAIQVRSQALAIAFLYAAFCFIYSPVTAGRRAIDVPLYVALLALTMVPWLFYIYKHFGEFYLLPKGGQGAMIWGAVPYYLDMVATNGKTLAEVSRENLAVSSTVYWNWRIFGYLQYMWADYWDERLVHPAAELSRFLPIQHLLVVPTLCLSPLLIWRGSPGYTLIALVPVAITYLGGPFHGLPRYAYPATPFLFIACGCLLALTAKRPEYISARILASLVRKVGLFASILLACLVVYSVTRFSFLIPGQMSQYRISKYVGAHISDLRPLSGTVTRTWYSGDFAVENVSSDNSGVLRNDLGGPAIIKLQLQRHPVPDKVVTKVDIDVTRSSYFDYVTVYWLADGDDTYTENKVYRPPASRLQRVTTLYLDDDVTDLMIVPAYFHHQSFRVNSISVQKLVPR